MDPRRFDTLARTLSPTDTRRGLLRRLAPLALAGVLGALLGQETTQADGSGAFAGRGRRRNRGKSNHHHKRDNGNNKCSKKCGPCARCKDGNCKAKPDGRACGDNGICTDGKCTSALTCPGLNQTCTTDPGTQCCPDIDPNVVCGGFELLTCQDCSRPMTAEGALCNERPGNQCCGSSPNCFVGVPVGTGPLGCFMNTPERPTVCEPCDADSGCPPSGDQFASATVCIRNDAGAGCCPFDSSLTTICASPCSAG
jgi:hypothetical protein